MKTEKIKEKVDEVMDSRGSSAPFLSETDATLPEKRNN